MLALLRAGGPVQLVDLAASLRQAREGFAVAAPASDPRREISGELAGKRQRRQAKRQRG